MGKKVVIFVVLASLNMAENIVNYNLGKNGNNSGVLILQENEINNTEHQACDISFKLPPADDLKRMIITAAVFGLVATTIVQLINKHY